MQGWSFVDEFDGVVACGDEHSSQDVVGAEIVGRLAVYVYAPALYNVLETENNKEGYVDYDNKVLERLERSGFGNIRYAASVNDYKPGDIMNNDEHMWIVVGSCDDGSVVGLEVVECQYFGVGILYKLHLADEPAVTECGVATHGCWLVLLQVEHQVACVEHIKYGV